MVNQVLVDRHMAGESPLGRRVRITERGEYVEIVGVVGSARTESFREAPIPFLYLPPGQTTPSSPDVPTAMTFVVRSADPSERLVPALTEAVARLDPKLPLGSLRTLDAVVDDHLARQDLVTRVLLGMAALGLVLAAVGVYGVITYVVVQRRREIGVRIAMGAGRPGLLARVVAGALVVVLAGAAGGLVVAFVAGRFVEGLLYGVGRTDPATYGAAFLLVVVTALVASLLPAWRASRMDASAVLREE